MSAISVTNIAPEVSEQQVSDFFSFCGKIRSIQLIPTSSSDNKQQSAKIEFEKEAAAKTALLLTDTKLGDSNVKVEPDLSSLAKGDQDDAANVTTESGDIRQEDKPKTAIIAEILSHGYILSDKAVEKSAEFDKAHGISARFQKFLAEIDSKYNISEKAAATESKYQLKEHYQNTFNLAHRYFDKALDSSVGSKVRAFYADAQKEAVDIHTEARRLANIRQGKTEASLTENQATDPAAAEPVVSETNVSSTL
ncbi:hypothetical protein V1514DRAFT_327409 [Lipomyces japonicus]|uniref:uncharacterized protein n=1 Tax=Lipomyces japonicus TaxID=56871 RepID=UPI0034CE44C2